MKLTQDEIFYISKFDALTKVMAKDCIVAENVIAFVVKPDDIGRAIGKNGKNARLLAKQFGKRVEIFALQDTPEEFIKSAFPDIKFSSVEKKGNTVIIKLDSPERRKFMEYIARFKRIKKFAERNYNIEDIRF